jgi:DNA-directed RNA polymerase subunit F
MMEALIKTFAETGLMGAMLGFLCYFLYTSHRDLIEILRKTSETQERTAGILSENRNSIDNLRDTVSDNSDKIQQFREELLKVGHGLK